MDEAADFFVSYTRADRAWAEWIAWQLEAEGYQVVVQAWDFTAGRDWAREMQHATATAERVVLVLSAAYLGSAHGEAEWRAFYAKDPGGERGLLLPVRVGPVEPPGLLKTRVYVDLVGTDAAGARAELLAAARGVRGKPDTEPTFPGSKEPQFPGQLPFEYVVDTLSEGKRVQAEDLPLTIGGRYEGDAPVVRVVLQDSYGNYYVQNPEVQFLPNGRWLATNVLPGEGIDHVCFVAVDAKGKDSFDQMVARREFGAFSTLPTNSKVLRCIRIDRV
jgi:TIR domain